MAAVTWKRLNVIFTSSLSVQKWSQLAEDRIWAARLALLCTHCMLLHHICHVSVVRLHLSESSFWVVLYISRIAGGTYQQVGPGCIWVLPKTECLHNECRILTNSSHSNRFQFCRTDVCKVAFKSFCIVDTLQPTHVLGEACFPSRKNVRENVHGKENWNDFWTLLFHWKTKSIHHYNETSSKCTPLNNRMNVRENVYEKDSKNWNDFRISVFDLRTE